MMAIQIFAQLEHVTDLLLSYQHRNIQNWTIEALEHTVPDYPYGHIGEVVLRWYGFIQKHYTYQPVLQFIMGYIPVQTHSSSDISFSFVL